MKVTIYYCAIIISNIVFAVVFHEHINISVMSLLPAFLMGLTIFQAAYFHSYRRKEDFNINIDSDLTEEEWSKLAVCMRDSYMLCAPLFIPFVIFFSVWIKTVSILLFFVGFSGGAVCFRLRYKKGVDARFANEARELEEQKKREELGKWK